MKSLKFKIWHEGMKDNSFSIRFPISKTFDHFMMEILDQMGWDDDHQYAIYCSYAGTTKNTRLRNSVVFTTSPMDENELTSRKKLSSVDWDGIKHIFVNYDFGDDHWFECKITNIIDDDTNKIVVVDPIKETFDQYR